MKEGKECEAVSENIGVSLTSASVPALSECLYSPEKSDDELIRARIDQFQKSYNTGDIHAVLECMDAKTRNTYQAAMNVGNVLIGKTGFGIALSDLFSLGIGALSEGDVLNLSDIRIHMTDSTHATVDVALQYQDLLCENQEEAFFTMVKEDGDWFIINFESK